MQRKEKGMPESFYLLLLPLRKICWSRENEIGEFRYYTKAEGHDEELVFKAPYLSLLL